jgi:hypothetical protein
MMKNQGGFGQSFIDWQNRPDVNNQELLGKIPIGDFIHGYLKI